MFSNQQKFNNQRDDSNSKSLNEVEFKQEIDKVINSKGNALKKTRILVQEIQEILISKGLELKIISYFSLIITLLSSDQNSMIEKDLIFLLNLSLDYLQDKIIIKKFMEISEILDSLEISDVLLETYQKILSCISSLSADVRVKKVFKKLMECTNVSSGKIRIKAKNQVLKLKSDYKKDILEFFYKEISDSQKNLGFILEFLLEFNQTLDSKDVLQKEIKKITRELLVLPKKIKEISSIKLVYQNLSVILDSEMAKDEDWDSLLEIKPFYNDSSLVPEYLKVMEIFFIKTQKSIYQFFISNFKQIFDVKSSSKNLIKECTATTLGNLILHAIHTDILRDTIQDFQEYILKTLDDSLDSLNFRDSWGYIIMIYQSVFVRLGVEAPELCKNGLVKLVDFRDKNYSNFPFKDQLEACLISAIQSLGIDFVLSVVPLNILQEIPGEATRPYLLATLEKALNGAQLESQLVPFSLFGRHSLKFFYENLFQVAIKLFEKSEALSFGGKDLDAKLYETLGLQAINLMPLIAKTRPLDFEIGLEMLTPFLGHILQSDPKAIYPNLPSHPDFRPLACDTLQKLIKGYVELVAELEEEDSDELNHAANGLVKVKECTNQFLSTLCNLYTTVSPEILENPTKGVALQNLHQSQSQYVEKTISTFLEIAEKDDVKSYFTSMLDLLQDTQSNLSKSKSAMSPESQLQMLRSYSVLELLLLMLDYLPSDDISPIEKHFGLIVGLLKDKDSTAQKKAYKSLVCLLEYIPLNKATFDGLTAKLLDDETVTSVTAGSKKARIQCIARLTEKVPGSESAWLLKWIPMCLSEVMLTTKESNEKARHAAYECLVAMGRRMMDSKVDNLSADPSGLPNILSSDDQMDEDGDVLTGLTSENGITEFFTMVSAGLAGTTPHFQSAAIGSLSRLFFEFHTYLQESFIESIIQAICSMLTSKSREILKSLLGFIKVLISSVSPSIIKLNLKNIVGGMMNQSKGEKAHFKSKIRHILERLIRKFGYLEIEVYIPEADQKLINNIKKRKERSKKRRSEKVHKSVEQDSGVEDTPKVSPNKSFEDTMYNSDSDIDSEMDEKYIPDRFKDETKTHSKTAATLVENQDDVLDFLDSSKITSQISSVSAKNSRKRSREEDFETDEYGRLVLAEPEEKEETPQIEQEDYYKQTLTGEGSFVRTRAGRIKFLDKGNKRAKTEELSKSGSDWRKKNHSKKVVSQTSQKLGEKYASKKAGGDVKRKGMSDPHAYIPLSGKIVGNRKKTTVFKNEFKKLLKSSHKRR